MSDRFQDRYRIPSSRALWWDYGRSAAYFVTICIDWRECYFGNIIETKIIVSPIGEIAQSCWSEIPQHFPYVQLDSFVVMPNHVHGIIIIDKRIGMIVKNGSIESKDNNPFNSMNNSTNAIIENSTDAPVGISTDVPVGISTDVPVETRLIASLQPNPTVQRNPTVQHDSSVNHDPSIQKQKSINKINPNFAWQARFYETIIRSEQSYRIKSEYIISNPSKWKDDQFYIS